MISRDFKNIDLQWQVGYSDSADEFPQSWYPATVPGAVQLDYARANNLQPWYFNDNFREYQWMEDKYWFYKAVFALPEIEKEEAVYFYSGGIDYRFRVILNGTTLHSQEGMYTPVDLLLGELQPDNELLIMIWPVPKQSGVPEGRRQADRTCKPPAAYGWDWHPRLIPAGIWQETYLQIRPQSHIVQVVIDYILAEDLTSVVFTATIKGNNLADSKADVIVRTPSASEVAGKEIVFEHHNIHTISFEWNNPLLWWPVGLGPQNIYTLEVNLKGNYHSISYLKTFGIRRTQLVMNEGAWDEPVSFPMSRSVPPMQLVINNTRVFAIGTNWVQPEVFYGTLDKKRYEEMLNLAVVANFNFLRMWGGGPVNKEVFFDLCDQKGIMVWQEFPLSCNEYQGTPPYLQVLEQEAVSIIERIKHHPCLVMWCGGNELFNSWSGMTDQSSALRLLNSLTLRLDPNTPFIATAPLMGMGHGHYVFRDNQSGEEVFNWMRRSKVTAFSEFGISSPAGVETLNSIIPDEEMFPPAPGSAWEWHHAFNAWREDTWLCLDTITHYFGNIMDLEDLVEKGQLIQAQGLKYIYEESRRQQPYCSMALNWCFNEPWPTAANSSIVSWPAVTKPAFFAVKQACRPALASARPQKFSYKPGEVFSADLFFLNHLTPAQVEESGLKTLTIDVFIDNCTQTIHLLTWDEVSVVAGENVAGPQVKLVLAPWNCNRFRLVLKVQEKPDWDSEYDFLLDVRR
jgi:beta-mannosidase